MVFGGIDTATGLALQTPLTSLPGSTTITALTSLAAQVIAAANQKIEDIAASTPNTSLQEEFAKVQKVALGETTQDLQQAGAGNKPIADVVNENTGTALTDQVNNTQVLSQSPTDLSLTTSYVAENLPIGTEVGTFSTVDPDSSGTFIYSLIGGTGSTDNNLFQITGDRLLTNTSFDYESKNSYNIRLQTSDGNGGVFQKALTINVTNVNENPTDLTLNNNAIAERRPIGTEIGSFSAIDPDGTGNFTYTLVSGAGSTDNNQFQIVGNRLVSQSIFDYESKNSHSIRVQVSDGSGGIFQQSLAINITDINEITGTAGNDILTGTSGDDVITGSQGSDIIVGGGGNDEFVYTSLIDARDTIKDFTVGSDKINFSQLLKSLNYLGSDPIADGYVQFTGQVANTSTNISFSLIPGSSDVTDVFFTYLSTIWCG